MPTTPLPCLCFPQRHPWVARGGCTSLCLKLRLRAPSAPFTSTASRASRSGGHGAGQHACAFGSTGQGRMLSQASRSQAWTAGGPCACCWSAHPAPAGRPHCCCRHTGQTLLHAAFNTWELSPKEGERLEMHHDGRIPRAEGERGGHAGQAALSASTLLHWPARQAAQALVSTLGLACLACSGVRSLAAGTLDRDCMHSCSLHTVSCAQSMPT